MCTVCGCADHAKSDEGHAHAHAHEHGHHHHDDVPDPAHAHVPGMSQARLVKIEQDILGKNNRYAAANRDYLARHGLFALNLVTSPGFCKTTLLTQTIERLKPEFTVGVIEGDQQTALDAERIRQTGARAVQINTGKGCHLDAHRVGHALEDLALPDNGVVFIENVGNLVCPAAFDLGEAHKVVVLSVTEGEDKPIKYPDMFHAADLMILNKIDLLPYLDFDVQQCICYARRVNPRITILELSAKTGQGMDAWLQWLQAGRTLNAIGQSLPAGGQA